VAQKKLKVQNSNVVHILLLSAIVITLYINPNAADPFNAPKMYILILFSSWLIGYLLFNFKSQKSDYKKLAFLSILFTATMLITAILTDVKYTAFFGDTQRQLGFLTYISFVIFMLVAARYFNVNFVNKFFVAIGFLGIFYIIYGLMQYTGNDVVKWVNQYNPIIGTLGNPNFAAAFMAMLGVVCLSLVFYKPIRSVYRLIFLIITFGLLVNIYLSNARQGLIAIGAGFALFLNLIIFYKKRFAGLIFLTLNLIFSSLVVLGMLQSGPLTKYLYKDSVTLRGYYWRAGINMLRENLFTGVGIDRYGANFKLYRDAGYSLKYGYEITSTNAHNVFIEYFATGGILLGLSYLSILIYIFYSAVKGIIGSNGEKRILLSGLFSAWVAYLTQSLVSIDNIGLTLWGWIFGGLIVAIASNKDSQSSDDMQNSQKITNSDNTTNLYRVLSSSIVTLVAFILVISLSKTESKMVDIRNIFSSGNQAIAGTFENLTNNVVVDKLAQPTYKVEIADYYIRSGQRDKGIKVLENLISSDPINPNYLIALAFTYESGGDFNNAILLRNKLILVDPYNTKNFLQLARLYKETGNMDKALEFKNRILEFAPNSEQATSVKSEIQS
jgi:O-antigen ligase